jgi:cytochrome c-type biogenesis protein CcmH/NrfF
MYMPKKTRDYRSLWLISIVLLVIGILLTIKLALIRPVGFVLLGIGGIGLVWSLSHMDKWKDKKDREDSPRQFR